MHEEKQIVKLNGPLIIAQLIDLNNNLDENVLSDVFDNKDYFKKSFLTVKCFQSFLEWRRKAAEWYVDSDYDSKNSLFNDYFDDFAFELFAIVELLEDDYYAIVRTYAWNINLINNDKKRETADKLLLHIAKILLPLHWFLIAYTGSSLRDYEKCYSGSDMDYFKISKNFVFFAEYFKGYAFLLQYQGSLMLQQDLSIHYKENVAYLYVENKDRVAQLYEEISKSKPEFKEYVRTQRRYRKNRWKK